MTRCGRFENEGLLLLEQGKRLDPHFDSCPDCLEARRLYSRLSQEITELDNQAEPAADWKPKVWAGLTAGRRRSWRWAAWVVPAGAIAALALIMVSLDRSRGPLALTADIYVGQTAVSRGQEAHPGDEMRVQAATAGYAHAELRIYLNDSEVIGSCLAGSTCARDGDRISLATVFKSLGTYRPVLIVSATAIPARLGNLEQDAGAALRGGAVVQAGDPIVVR